MNLQHTRPFPRLLSLLALLASAITAGQIGMILVQGDPLCLNQGCEVVEQLTRVPPLFFNLAGLFFFQSLYWGVRWANRGSAISQKLVPLLLLVGACTEGVLISFQHLVAQTFCSYCLLIFACILLANLLSGARHFFYALVLFSGVSAAFFSLEHTPAAQKIGSYTSGVFASRMGTTQVPASYLFYSTSCSHCKEVNAFLAKEEGLSVHFNPIDNPGSAPLPQATLRESYSSRANRQFLASLGLDEIPVLLVPGDTDYRIVKGKTGIIRTLSELSQQAEAMKDNPEEDAAAAISPFTGLEEEENSDEGCTVGSSCEEESELIPPSSDPLKKF
ncbi:hypothetical protein [Desulfogranum mediterraneum]|uniref:hypothetical protein n=1 Tax=Desulfogranum mediterraneum TaxID=160661 RepID=UPI0004297245|nr:hypothetical protein [Desulfogranum mediterraneum]